jgi:hypothetical protein
MVFPLVIVLETSLARAGLTPHVIKMRRDESKKQGVRPLLRAAG